MPGSESQYNGPSGRRDRTEETSKHYNGTSAASSAPPPPPPPFPRLCHLGYAMSPSAAPALVVAGSRAGRLPAAAHPRWPRGRAFNLLGRTALYYWPGDGWVRGGRWADEVGLGPRGSRTCHGPVTSLIDGPCWRRVGGAGRCDGRLAARRLTRASWPMDPAVASLSRTVALAARREPSQ